MPETEAKIKKKQPMEWLKWKIYNINGSQEMVCWKGVKWDL